MIIAIVIWISLALITGTATMKAIRRKQEERANIEFANRPKEELLAIALQEYTLAEQYRAFRRCMSDEAAADFVINKMLIDLKVIGYRKEES